MTATIDGLFHYPIKGLSAQRLESVTLEPGRGFPLDRAFGLARHDSGFDPDNPRPLPKSKFLVLARDASLARLKTQFTPETNILSVTKGGETTDFDITDPMALDVLMQMLADHVGLAADAHPSLQSADPHRFTDVSVVSPQMMNAVSLINADSVSAFSKALGQEISPARFRGNILFSGMEAFAELEIVGQTLKIGDVSLEIAQRTRRCPATEVNLDTGARDVDVPGQIEALYGHRDMGIYAHVTHGGTLRPGDKIEVS